MTSGMFRVCQCCGRPVPVGKVCAETPTFICSVCAWRMEVRA